MGTLVLNGATSGSTTLQPTDATTQTITLPANSGTVITTQSSGKVIPTAALPAGTVLQVVSANFATGTSTSSVTTWIDTGISVSITPTSNTSKVYVFATLGDANSSNGNNGLQVKLVRNSTDLGVQQSAQWGYTGQATNNIFSGSLQYLDSPATTSSTTYKVQFRGQGGSFSWMVMRDNTQATITLMEIAA